MFFCFLMTALAQCVHWLRVVVPKLGVLDSGIRRAPLLLLPSLPRHCFCCRSSNPSCESLALSINSLLTCFTIHLIQQQAAGPQALRNLSACSGAHSSLPRCWSNMNHILWFCVHYTLGWVDLFHDIFAN